MTSRIEGWNTDTPSATEAGTKPLALPLSVQQQQMQLARKQQLIQAMLGQQLQDKGGTQMAGNIAIKKSPFEALSQTLAAGMLGHKQKELDERGVKIGEEYNALGQREMQKYLDMANGTPADPRTLLPEGMSGPQDRGAPGDPKRALTEGLMAQHADVRAAMIAKQKQEDAMARMMKERQLKGLTDQEAVKSINEPNTLAQAKGKANLQAIAPNSSVVDESGAPATPLPKEAQMVQKVDAKGNRIQENPWNKSEDYTDKASKISLSNNAQVAGQKAGAQTYATQLFKGLGEAEDAVRDSSNMMGQIDELKSLHKAGLFDGFGSNQVTALAKIGQKLGIEGANAGAMMANQEAYTAVQNAVWQSLVKKSGGNKGVTAEEAAEIKKIVPLATNSPQARERLFEIFENAHERQLHAYNAQNQAAQAFTKTENPADALEAQRRYYEGLRRVQGQQQPGVAASSTSVVLTPEEARAKYAPKR